MPQGVAATVGERAVAVGNLRLLAGQCGGYIAPELARKDSEWRSQGELRGNPPVRSERCASR